MNHLSASDHQAYYDSYWANHNSGLNTHEILRLSEILKGIALVIEVTRRKSFRICDLGCGRGWLSGELCKFGSVTGVDLSGSGIEEAKRRCPNVTFCIADITSWRPPEAFDMVISSEVIEHVPDQQAFADTVRHLLREGGHLILTTPNRKVKESWQKSGHNEQLVEQWLSRKELQDLFSDMQPLAHSLFIYDFSYTGVHRFLSAPKVLALIRYLGSMQVYDSVRNLLGLGLYQIIVAQSKYQR